MTVVPEASPSSWSKLSAFVCAQLGLHFPAPRLPDLQRGLRQAAQELGFSNDEACIRSLLASAAGAEGLQALANHLTVGETYFFRDQPALEALAGEVLPGIVRERRSGSRQLRLWCAACCTGEEAYTLAILVHRLLPDLKDWDVSLLATDVNTRYLQKARAGRYGEWSFRDAPAWLRPRYFERHADGSATVRPEIRRMVRFEKLNLAHPAPGFGRSDLGMLDVVVCRNALMYFTAAQAAGVVDRIWASLRESAWLLTAPGEAGASVPGRFEVVSFPGALLLRKQEQLKPQETRALDGAALPTLSDAAVPAALVAAPMAAPMAAPAMPYEQTGSTSATPHQAVPPPTNEPAWARLAQDHANRGRLAEALSCCDRWIAADKLDPAAHHLRGVVLWERGDNAAAESALQRAIYLDSGFVLAHFALGQLARAGGDALQAGRHFKRALGLLQRLAADEPLPGADELTAGRLRETLHSLTMQPELAA